MAQRFFRQSSQINAIDGGFIGLGLRICDTSRAHPLLAECLPHVGHFVIRNRGTVGGSIAHADAAAELPLAFVVAGGSVRARSTRGEREIRAGDFFVGPFTTALDPKNTNAGATSSGCAGRCIGCDAPNSRTSPASRSAGFSGVHTGPGATQFTRIPRCTRLCASDFVNAWMAPFVAE